MGTLRTGRQLVQDLPHGAPGLISGFISSHRRQGALPCAWPLSGCSPHPSELTETLPASHYKLSHSPLNNKSQGLSPGCQPRWVGCVWLLTAVCALCMVETQARTRCITGWITRNPRNGFSIVSPVINAFSDTWMTELLPLLIFLMF